MTPALIYHNNKEIWNTNIGGSKNMPTLTKPSSQIENIRLEKQ